LRWQTQADSKSSALNRMESVGIQFEKILELYSRKDYGHAIKLLDELLSATPNFQRGLFLKGVILEETGKPEKAKQYLDKAGNLFTLHYRLALQLQDSDPERALIYFDKATDSDPGNNTLWFAKGLLYEKLGRQEEAKACYKNMQMVREFLSRVLIPCGFIIILVGGAVAMFKKGENGLATVVVASAVFSLFWLKRDGGKALQMLLKKRQAS